MYTIYHPDLPVSNFIEIPLDLEWLRRNSDQNILRFSSVGEYIRGGSRISGNGVHMYKGVGGRFAGFISFF